MGTTTTTKRRRDEQGVVSVWFLITMAALFAGIVGLVYDGGQILNQREAFDRAAGQAARAGAAQLSAAGVRNGTYGVATQEAITTANNYLTSAGLHGSVTVNGQVVTVTVSGSYSPTFLGSFGMPTIAINETESAQGIQGGP